MVNLLPEHLLRDSELKSFYKELLIFHNTQLFGKNPSWISHFIEIIPSIGGFGVKLDKDWNLENLEKLETYLQKKYLGINHHGLECYLCGTYSLEFYDKSMI